MTEEPQKLSPGEELIDETIKSDNRSISQKIKDHEDEIRFHLQRLGIKIPETRHDCSEIPRPCPFVRCKHHLAISVSPRTGHLTIHAPDFLSDKYFTTDEKVKPAESCSLDVADDLPQTLEQIATIFDQTRENIRKIEQLSFLKMLADPAIKALSTKRSREEELKPKSRSKYSKKPNG